jgi:hypothetical protein
MSVDLFVERVTRALAIAFVATATLIVAIEWLFRQARDSNVIFEWLEPGVTGAALGGAFALPSMLVGRGGQGSQSLSTWSAWAMAAVAAAIAISLFLFVATGDPQAARSHYYPAFTLTAPMLVFAAGAAIWLLRWGLRLGASNSETRGNAGAAGLGLHDRDAAIAAAALAGSLGVIVACAPSFAAASALIGQSLWGVVAQDGFLAVVLACVLVQAIAALFLRPDELRARALLTGMLPASAGDGESKAVWAVGALMPTGWLVLMLGLLLGLRPSEALAAVAPSCAALGALVALALLCRLAWRKGPRARAGSTVQAADAVLIAVTLVVAIGVLRSYARLVEALAIFASAATLLVLLRARRGATDVRRFASVTVTRIGFAVLFLFAAASLRIAADLVGLTPRIGAFGLLGTVGVTYVAVAALVVSVLLARWLAPLGLALCAMPLLPAALSAAGAGVFQALTLHASIIVAAGAVHAFVDGSDRPPRADLLLAAGLSLVLVILVAVFPAASEWLPEAVRLW